MIFGKAAERFAASSPRAFFPSGIPALGRGRRSRPPGKMLRRRKMLEITPDFPASGARFVGRRAVVADSLLTKDLFVKRLKNMTLKFF